MHLRKLLEKEVITYLRARTHTGSSQPKVIQFGLKHTQYSFPILFPNYHSILPKGVIAEAVPLADTSMLSHGTRETSFDTLQRRAADVLPNTAT